MSNMKLMKTLAISLIISLPFLSFPDDGNVIKKILDDAKKVLKGERQEEKINQEGRKKEVKNKKQRDFQSKSEKIEGSEKVKEYERVGERISKIFTIRVEGAIGPAVASYVIDSLEKAAKEGATLFLILLDTPGGLDLAMRDIVRAIESSYVPVCVFVWPVGARAASAGTFITVSAHIAAMAPGTSIGAASPVLMGGQKIDEKLRKKIENDAIAYIRALAQRHGRNAKALEKTVKEAATFTAEEALKNNIIDVVAEGIDDLVKKISGKKVKTVAGEVTLNITSYEIVKIEPNIKYKILKVISDPNVAYILMTIGIWGIFFELANPGAILPGVVGALCLILGLYSLQALPVNWAGLALIVLAIIFFLLEVKMATSGILALAGILSMFLGSLMLFESPEPFFRASYKAIISSTVATAAFFIFVAYKALSAQRRTSIVGFEGLINQVGEALNDFKNGRGKIFVSGEIWDAELEDEASEVKKGDKLSVVSNRGMTLIVKKVK